MMARKFVIPIAPVTKKNSQRIINCGKYHKIMPSKAYEQYKAAAGAYIGHLRRAWGTIDQPCEVKCLFYMPTRRKVDLTNLLEAIDDVMVKYGILADDNSQIIVSHDGSRVLYDKENPRTDVYIRDLMEGGRR